jgi:hypothetical protein
VNLLRAAEAERRIREARRRAEQATTGVPWSLEHFCGDHKEQLAFCSDRSPWIHAMCARQSGKTQGDDGILLDNAVAQPGSTNIFLGLKGTGVRISNWFPIWTPLLDRYSIERKDTQDEMLTTLPNRARVLFGGTDDLTNVRRYLGNRLANSVFIIDECQDQPDGVLRYILGTLLPPMLTPTSRVILSGVLPDMEVGYFYELATDKPLAESPALRVSKGYSHHEWGRAANVHTPEAMDQLKLYMDQHGLTVDDPQIARDWFMRRKWLKDAGAYWYDRARNGYYQQVPEWLEAERSRLEAMEVPIASLLAAVPHECVQYFSAAIDPGGGDRCALEVLGWGDASRKVQQVGEWSTPRGQLTPWSKIFAVADVFQRHFAPGWWHYDSNSQNELDNVSKDYQLPVIRPAKKADMPGQIRRNNDLLTERRMEVMVGSALEEDYLKARFDKEARAKRIYRWASGWHPDPSECARYALDPYWDAYELKDTRPRIEKEAAAFVQDDDDTPDVQQPDALATALGWRH